ncbi:outer dense fiber protein 4 [Pipistrellus kuhlii]|uniref:outer dense fiber protein 4 n=1 Tax=Pipistrellus kuhlii TaxID=59472 RepID=UPI001E270ACE|nr:outer dense fiber protein 4 [Pipistrellus kuhlii]
MGYHRRDSLLPLRWRVAHTSRWKVQVLTSVLSLIAFTMLLIMSFSKGWLYLSTIRFLQRWPEHVRQSIIISAGILSHGPLQNCIFQSCSYSEEEDFLELWTDHPFFGVSKVTFNLSLLVGFLQTVWLYLPYVPSLRRVPLFGCIGWHAAGIDLSVSCLLVACLFTSLHCFSINIWLYELKQNFSVYLGWSYFIGWVVFMLYLICAFLCYFNNKKFWSLIVSTTSSIISFSSSRSRSRSSSLVTES